MTHSCKCCSNSNNNPLEVTGTANEISALIGENIEEMTPRQLRLALLRAMQESGVATGATKTCMTSSIPNKEGGPDRREVKIKIIQEQDTGGKKRKRTAAQVLTCGRRHVCPVCAASAGSALADEINGAAYGHFGNQITAPRDGRGLYAVMLSQPHSEGQKLSDHLDWSAASWRRLNALQRHRWLLHGDHITGTVAVTEFTVGENGYHVHIHALVFTEGWIQGTRRQERGAADQISDRMNADPMDHIGRMIEGLSDEEAAERVTELMNRATAEGLELAEWMTLYHYGYRMWPWATNVTAADCLQARARVQTAIQEAETMGASEASRHVARALRNASGKLPVSVHGPGGDVEFWCRSLFEAWIEVSEHCVPDAIKATGRVRPAIEAQHMQSITSIHGLGGYLAKFGIGAELGLGATKHARGKNRTHWEVALDLHREFSREDYAIWREVEEALCANPEQGRVRSRRMVRWSRGLRQKYGIKPGDRKTIPQVGEIRYEHFRADRERIEAAWRARGDDPDAIAWPELWGRAEEIDCVRVPDWLWRCLWYRNLSCRFEIDCLDDELRPLIKTWMRWFSGLAAPVDQLTGDNVVALLVYALKTRQKPMDMTRRLGVWTKAHNTAVTSRGFGAASSNQHVP